MAKCVECQKYEAADRWYEKLASWLVWHIFPKTVRDEKNSTYLQGWEHGYTTGRKHERDVMDIDQIIKDIKNEKKTL